MFTTIQKSLAKRFSKAYAYKTVRDFHTIPYPVIDEWGKNVKDEDGNDIYKDLSIWQLARKMGFGELASLLSDFVNVMGRRFETGFYIGQLFRNEHRTLQGSLVELCFGILAGISDFSKIAEKRGWTEEEAVERLTDPRNSGAIKAALAVTKLREEGELDHQLFI